MIKDSWNMTDEEFNESLAIEKEEDEKEKPTLITKKEKTVFGTKLKKNMVINRKEKKSCLNTEKIVTDAIRLAGPVRECQTLKDAISFVHPKKVGSLQN